MWPLIGIRRPTQSRRGADARVRRRLAVRRDPVVDDLEALLVEALRLRQVAREAARDRDVHVREAGDGPVAERERAALAELVEAVLRGEADGHAREQRRPSGRRRRRGRDACAGCPAGGGRDSRRAGGRRSGRRRRAAASRRAARRAPRARGRSPRRRARSRGASASARPSRARAAAAAARAGAPPSRRCRRPSGGGARAFRPRCSCCRLERLASGPRLDRVRRGRPARAAPRPSCAALLRASGRRARADGRRAPARSSRSNRSSSGEERVEGRVRRDRRQCSSRTPRRRPCRSRPRACC